MLMCFWRLVFSHLVDFGVEVDEEDEGDDSEDDEAAPVVVGRVGGVHAQRRRQLHRGAIQLNLDRINFKSIYVLMSKNLFKLPPE